MDHFQITEPLEILTAGDSLAALAGLECFSMAYS